MADRLAYLQLFPDDFLASVLVSGESLAATGARVRLWCVAARAETPGCLPDDDNFLCRAAMMTQTEWSSIKSQVVAGWLFADGHWWIRRIVKRAKFRDAMQHAADLRWHGSMPRHDAEASSHGSILPIPVPVPVPVPVPTPVPVPSEDTKTKIASEADACAHPGKPLDLIPPETKARTNSGFEEFWKAYPRKTARQAAERAWKKHRPPLERCLRTLAWQMRSDQWQQGIITHASTWINQHRWDDEESAGMVKPASEPKGYRGLRELRRRITQEVPGATNE